MAKSRSDYAEFDKNDVEILKKESLYKDYFQVDKYTLRHKTHEGGWSNTITREIFERGHASAMLPYDPEKDQIILVEQFRPGAHLAGYNPWLLEVPAGIIETGQTPAEVAEREITEETGCTTKHVELIADYLVTPGGSTETMHLFCVEIDIDEASEFAGLAHEGEHIKIHKFDVTTAFEFLEDGQIHNSMTIIAIQWLKLHHDKLRKRWCSNK